jgi:hypothetical protein
MLVTRYAITFKLRRGASLIIVALYALGNFFIVSGYGGQTLETLALPGEGAPFERVTGFPLRSYVTASFTYHFRRHGGY